MNIFITRKRLLWQIMLWGVLLDLALVGLSLLLHPSLLEARYVSTAIFCVILLLVYGCIGVGLPLLSDQAVTRALWQGTGFGLLMGSVFVINIAVEYFFDMNSQASTLSTLGFMALLFLLFGVASARTVMQTGQLLLGVLTSVWSAFLAILITVLFGVVVNFFFQQRLEHILASDYLRSGMSDLGTFTFFNTLDSASSHLLEAPLLAAIFGILGGLIGKRLLSLRGNH